VPAIIISPYARHGYVDHTFYTFTSMIRLIEDVNHLPTMTHQDKAANDMAGAFDFSQAPAAPLTLPIRQCPQ
jgi:phospholipase C